MSDTIHHQEISTSWGSIFVRMSDGKVIHCTLPYLKDDPDVPFAISARSANPVVQFVCDLFHGRRTGCLPIGVLTGSPFQQRVWSELREIPAGETRSYRAVAEAIGKPQAFRAVANACGRNPVPLFIPCHRVIGSDGKLRGFSAGTPWKRLLLTSEARRRI